MHALCQLLPRFHAQWTFRIPNAVVQAAKNKFRTDDLNGIVAKIAEKTLNFTFLLE